MQILLEVIGWTGSVLIVLSLAQARVLRFRWLNLVGSIIAVGYNLAIGVYPFAAMNTVTAAISAYWLIKLYRETKDPQAYQVLQVEPGDAFLQHLLHHHAADISKHAPDFDAAPPADGKRKTFVVVRGDEAVGAVALRDQGEGIADVELDWVTERFRDFGPGRFVYRESGALPAAGIRRVQLIPHDATDREYLRKAGFTVERTHWVRDLV